MKPRTGVLVHKPHQFDPDDLLHFVETDEFCEDWYDLGFNLETDLWELQTIIMSAPDRAPVIPATGGLRKLRFGRKQQGVGKSGGARVCYAYFKKHRIVLLVMAYGKDRKDDLTSQEKHGIAEYLARIEHYLDERT